MSKAVAPTILVIFGISGDLSRRYLLPALAELGEAGELGEQFRILGLSRRSLSVEEVLGEQQKNLVAQTELLQMDPSVATDYPKLKDRLAAAEASLGGLSGTPQVIYYFAVPPASVLPIIQHLGNASLNGPHAKLLLEKPFGTDQHSAQTLIDTIRERFPDEQVYRIDHYLAKEMAQNIVVFLGSNALIRDVWSNQFIDKIEVIVAEAIGIEGRAAFYEGMGALREIIQSHALQLAALTLMQPCSDIFDFDEIPMRRLAALKQLRLADQPAPVRAQYTGYRDEVSNPGSTTETFAALSLTSDDPRWADVPIRLITGKNLDQRLTEIRVHFKKNKDSEANQLCLRVQPKEAIELDLWVKPPGYERQLEKLPLHFAYGEHFDRLPDAYEMVLLDAMRSNHSLFASSDEVLASWAILQPLLERWSAGAADLKTYSPGSPVAEVLKA